MYICIRELSFLWNTRGARTFLVVYGGTIFKGCTRMFLWSEGGIRIFSSMQNRGTRIFSHRPRGDQKKNWWLAIRNRCPLLQVKKRQLDTHSNLEWTFFSWSEFHQQLWWWYNNRYMNGYLPFFSDMVVLADPGDELINIWISYQNIGFTWFVYLYLFTCLYNMLMSDAADAMPKIQQLNLFSLNSADADYHLFT